MDTSPSALWSGLNSGVVLSVMAVLWTVVWQNLQALQLHQTLGRHVSRHARRLAAVLDPYLSVTVAEYDGGRMRRNDAFDEIKAYLDAAIGGGGDTGVRHLRAEAGSSSGSRQDAAAGKLVLSMADREEIPDEFAGAQVWWSAYSTPPPRGDGFFPWWSAAAQEDRRFYRLVFHRRDRSLVLDEYLLHVRRRGREAMVRNRQRKLFTNLSGGSWSSVAFEHPKTFATLAMDPAAKKRVMDDLDTFRDGKAYHARVGKAWKRGYLLHGPPGTGKSAMVAAMANHLDYDVYDIELTSVQSNTDLRRLFIETTSKSIIVIEDIDCSLDLTGARHKKKNNPAAAAAAEDSSDRDKSKKKKEQAAAASKVTLSGLLNFIDGLWSSCGGERIIVFTTNHKDKLDKALIRTGRMDRHIEMSYCCFQAFKFLAKLYLDVDHHDLFRDVEELLNEADMTPADVAENLTRKSADDDDDSCLATLVKALQDAKEKKAKGQGKGQDDQDEEEDN